MKPLAVLGLMATRRTHPVRDPAADHFSELAVGETEHVVFVRGPSGKPYIISVPGELFRELESEPVPAPGPYSD